MNTGKGDLTGASVVARHEFLPFGEEISAGVGMRTSGQGIGATGKIRQRYGLTERDDATGLDHTWWRKYENRSGRWTSADPYNGSMTITDPQSFNKYSYTGNDPVNFIDPSGLAIAWVCGTLWQSGERIGEVCGFAHFDSPFPGLPGEPNPRGGGRERPQNPAQREECAAQQSGGRTAHADSFVLEHVIENCRWTLR